MMNSTLKRNFFSEKTNPLFYANNHSKVKLLLLQNRNKHTKKCLTAILNVFSRHTWVIPFFTFLTCFPFLRNIAFYLCFLRFILLRYSGKLRSQLFQHDCKLSTDNSRSVSRHQLVIISSSSNMKRPTLPRKLCREQRATRGNHLRTLLDSFR